MIPMFFSSARMILSECHESPAFAFVHMSHYVLRISYNGEEQRGMEGDGLTTTATLSHFTINNPSKFETI